MTKSLEVHRIGRDELLLVRIILATTSVAEIRPDSNTELKIHGLTTNGRELTRIKENNHGWTQINFDKIMA